MLNRIQHNLVLERQVSGSSQAKGRRVVVHRLKFVDRPSGRWGTFRKLSPRAVATLAKTSRCTRNSHRDHQKHRGYLLELSLRALDILGGRHIEYRKPRGLQNSNRKSSLLSILYGRSTRFSEGAKLYPPRRRMIYHDIPADLRLPQGLSRHFFPCPP